MIVLYLQARMASNRCPNKVAMSLAGKPAFVRCAERALEYINPDRIVLGTTLQANDDPLVFLAKHEGYEVFRDQSDHARRVLKFTKGLGEDDIFVEIGCDSPLAIAFHLPMIIELMQKGWERYWHYSEYGTFRVAVSEFFGYRPRVHIAMCKERDKTAIYDTTDKHVWLEAPRDGSIICQFDDPIYSEPWVYDDLTMDFPSQALIIRQIYQDLYMGKPLNHHDIWDYLHARPFMLSQLQSGHQVANQPMHPWGQKGLYEQIRNTVDYIEVLVKEDASYEIIGGSDGKETKKERKRK